MKRVLALMIGVCLISGIVCSCTKPKEVSKDEAVTLTWYIPGAKPKDCDKVEEKINNIITDKIGAKLDFVYLDSGAYDEKMNMMMASKTEFDLCFSGWTNKYQRGVSLDGFLKINDYIDKSEALKKAIPEYAWKAVTTSDGGIYAVPNLQIYAMWQGIFVTKKYADKYNLNVNEIKKIEDLEPFLQQIHDNEPDVYGFTPTIYPWVGVDSTVVLSGNGEMRINNFDDKSKIYKAYETPEYEQGIRTLRSFYKKGFIRQDIASAANDTSSSKQTVVTIGACKPGVEADTALTDRGECVVIPLGTPCVSNEMALQTLTAVSSTSRNPEKAVKLLELVNTDKEVFRLIVHGIEDEHYELLEDGHIRILNKDGYNFHTSGWYFGNQFNSYVVEGKEIDIWDKMAELNNSAIKSNTLGFTFDTTNVTNEVANISAVISEFSGLSNGSVDIDSSYSAYKKKLKEAGIDKVIKEAQKQVNEFIKNKK